MKRRCSGFTLIELMAAMLIIIVISGLVVGIFNFVNAKTNRTKAAAEIKMYGAAISSYSTDFGGPPQTGDTNKLSPLTHFVPTSTEYDDANRDLYKALTGDANRNNKVDPSEKDAKRYIQEIDILKLVKWDETGKEVKYFKDPFNYPYGYSTAALKAEQDFKEEIRENGRAAERQAPVGFNASGYDMWSTSNNKRDPAGDDETMKKLWKEWVKNW